MRTCRRGLLVIVLAFAGWLAGLTVAHGQMSVPTLRYEQGPFTLTNATVVRPSTCTNAAGSCGSSTPSWVTDRNTNYCLYSLNSAGNVNWTASTLLANPNTGTTPTAQTWAGPGEYAITGRFNLLNFKMIAAGANVNVQISCGW